MTTRLRTLLGTHPCTAALKDGSITSDSVAFDFVEYSPANKGFKPMVREGAFDVSEMAIVTYLMARSVGKPSGSCAPRRNCSRPPSAPNRTPSPSAGAGSPDRRGPHTQERRGRPS